MTATAAPAAPATIPTSRAASRTSRPRCRWCCRRPDSRRCTCTAPRRARSAPAPTRRRSPSASTGWCCRPSPTRAPARRRSRARNAVAERYAPTTARKRDAAMIRSIFTRDGHASGYDLAVAEAIAAEELKFGDQVPTGTYLDMAVNLPLVDPKKVLSPVLMVRGDARRQLDQRGPARFLRAAAERRPPVRDPAAHRAQPRLQQQPASAVVRDAQFPARAGGDPGVVSECR